MSFFFFLAKSEIETAEKSEPIAKPSTWELFFGPAPAHSHRIFNHYHPLPLMCHPTPTSLHRDTDHFLPAAVFSIENLLVPSHWESKTALIGF